MANFRFRTLAYVPAMREGHKLASDGRTREPRKTTSGSVVSRHPCPIPSIIEEAPEHPGPARVLQLPQRLGLDLADALARHRELLTDLFQRVVGVHADAEAHAQHPLLARGERGEYPRRYLTQIRLDRRIDRQDSVLVLD